MFQPALSWSTVRVWVPAGRVTVRVHRRPGLVAAGGRDVHAAAEVGAGAVVDVQAVGDRAGRGQPQADGVGAGGGDVDGVLEPLPGRGPAEVVAAAGVGGGLQVHPVGAVAVGGAVHAGDVVGHGLPAGVVVLRLDRAGHRRRGPAVRSFAGRRRSPAARAVQAEGEEVDVPAAVVLVHGQGLGAGRQGDGRGDGGPGLVAAGGRDVHVAAEVGAGAVVDVQAVGDRGWARPRRRPTV